MLLSIALIFILSLSFGWVLSKLRLPALIGMIFTGMILGPYCLDLISPGILNISAELRKIALIIILIRAGLSLNIKELRENGMNIILMSFMPALFEVISYALFAGYFFGFSIIESILLGSVIAAVSPAVIVPRMLKLKSEGWGVKQKVPQTLIASTSVDDVFVIVIFTVFLGLVQNVDTGQVSTSAADILKTVVSIPVSLISGIVVGGIGGYLFNIYFKKFHIRDTIKVLIILSIAMLMIVVEDVLKNIFDYSSLISIMTLGITLNYYYPVLTERLSFKFQKLWIAAEIILFVLVGAIMDVKYVGIVGWNVVFMLAIGVAFRMAGVYLSLLGSSMTNKEKLFCMIAFTPKATVQAAIGSIALSAGLPCGVVILSVAVISILLTAPLGAMTIDMIYKKLLRQ